MGKFCIYFVLAIVISEAVGMAFRHKRQSDTDDENNLDNRYGYERPWDNQWQQPDEGREWQRPTPRPNTNQQWPQPNPNQQWPQPDQNQNQNQNQNQGQTSTTPRPSNGSTSQSPALAQCMRNCPVTPEYNPVCGSDSVTYNNPGLLICAQGCGVSVNLARSSRCPTTTPAPN